MILVRAPFRISFVGGGTDLRDFYSKYPGRVLSTSIDKYMYIALNRTPLVNKVSARYSKSETVSHPNELQHTRVKAALLDLGITNNIEVASFAPLPSGTGLGSSSSFSVALAKALNAYLGKKIDKREAAEAACRLEIELLKEPIGKQDQYAAAFGGFNIIQFNADETVTVEPVLADFKKTLGLQAHSLLFFTGLTRDASSVLTKQKANTEKKFEVLKAMSDSVFDFRDRFVGGDFQGMGKMLHEGWTMKKTLASNVSNPALDALYAAGMNNGAWGGKVLGAGGGGCILFLAPVEKQLAIRKALAETAKTHTLHESKEIPFQFVQSGVETIFNGDHLGTTLS
ncbi:MAG: GHMP kinase [bacterium]|nr:GHMP kinase [bacterium]